ncbi:MAG: uroporphyrinogen decarboxylase family protein, partial [Armatimonadetes bacterium]|nr:uroporphyrinogen decarboxylase family protein [Armatimonadota bacterium]
MPATQVKPATRRELLLAALRREPTERTPWLPYLGSHGGALLGMSAAAYLRDAAAIVQGVAAAAEAYRADGLPVVFDLQIEAEAAGCRLMWSDDNPPAVVSHPLAEGVELADLPLPGPESGRFPLVREAIRGARREVGDRVALFGLVTGPFTLALHLLGPDIFVQMFEEPDDIAALMDWCRQVACRTADWYLDSGCDVIAIVDPMTSQVSPRHFEQFITGPATCIFAHLRARGAPSAFFVCGDAQKNVVKMAETRPDSIFVDEQIDLSWVAGIAAQHAIAFGGNIPLTTVLLHGTPDDCRRAARQCLDLGGSPGFILAPGCDLPYATPPANLAAVAEVVHGEHSGEVAATVQQKIEVELPDYAQRDTVYVDIFTLDSAACAPCQYMVEAVIA